MNPNARTACIEVLFNPDEFEAFDGLCKVIGVARSTFLRGLANQQVRMNGMPPPDGLESRGCRGVGRPANRASVGSGRIHAFFPGRAKARGVCRRLQV
jgi:hypothetical protein